MPSTYIKQPDVDLVWWYSPLIRTLRRHRQAGLHEYDPSWVFSELRSWLQLYAVVERARSSRASVLNKCWK